MYTLKQAEQAGAPARVAIAGDSKDFIIKDSRSLLLEKAALFEQIETVADVERLGPKILENCLEYRALRSRLQAMNLSSEEMRDELMPDIMKMIQSQSVLRKNDEVYTALKQYLK